MRAAINSAFQFFFLPTDGDRILNNGTVFLFDV